ncbi:DNA-directed RNA polymerase subunit omega [Acidobacteria bacterium AH-259-D05]|nr:DNA-directed RNA polymerase subunit omega [Acidobacteria bacterium AH-259-D05]
MIIKIPEEFDSKFRFILVAAERAKQIQNGAPPRLDLKSRKPAYLAIREVEENIVPYVILEEAGHEEEE